MGFPPGEIVPDAAGPAPGAVSPARDAAGPAPVADGVAGADGLTGPGEQAGVRGLAGVRAVVPRAPQSTGDPRVDDAVARLDDLAGLPLAEHLAVFEYVHERLTEALGDLDVHATAGAGDQSHASGASGG
jgi:hypothetical protein